MAAPFNSPLPATGDRPWTLNPAIIEMRGRQASVEDTINTGRLSVAGLQDEILAAAEAITADELSDNFVAAQVASPTSETNAALVEQIDDTFSPVGSALSGRFMVHRLWTGTDYPPRVPGAVNVFIGPVSPGLAAAPTDYWASPAGTTMADVVTAASTPSSDLSVAIRSTMTQSVPLNISAQGATLEVVGASPNRLMGYQMVKAANRLLYTHPARKPDGWNTVRLRIFFIPVDATPGDVRFSVDFTPFNTSTARSGENVQVTAPVPAAGQVGQTTLVSSLPLANIDSLSVMIARLPTNANDTYANTVHIIGARLERAS